MMKQRKEKGFTLIELMIVVAIIGILAALALPKFAQLVEKSREAATKGNMNALRSSISIYYGDSEGIYPGALDCGDSFSKFMEKIPPVKATHAGVGFGTLESPSGTAVVHTTDESITATGTGWKYNPQSGRIFINSAATDSKTLPYSVYGY